LKVTTSARSTVTVPRPAEADIVDGYDVFGAACVRDISGLGFDAEWAM